MENKESIFTKTHAQEIVDFLENNYFEIHNIEILGSHIDSQIIFRVHKKRSCERVSSSSS